MGTTTSNFAAQKIAGMTGRVTVSTTAARLMTSSTWYAKRSICVQAESTNTGNVMVGDSTVSTTNGIVVPPGESITLEVADPTEIWVVCAGTQYVRGIGV